MVKINFHQTEGFALTLASCLSLFIMVDGAKHLIFGLD